MSWPRDRYTGPGGGLHTGPSNKPYHSNLPPRDALLDYLERNGRQDLLQLLKSVGF